MSFRPPHGDPSPEPFSCVSWHSAVKVGGAVLDKGASSRGRDRGSRADAPGSLTTSPDGRRKDYPRSPNLGTRRSSDSTVGVWDSPQYVPEGLNTDEEDFLGGTTKALRAGTGAEAEAEAEAEAARASRAGGMGAEAGGDEAVAGDDGRLRSFSEGMGSALLFRGRSSSRFTARAFVLAPGDGCEDEGTVDEADRQGRECDRGNRTVRPGSRDASPGCRGEGDGVTSGVGVVDVAADGRFDPRDAAEARHRGSPEGDSSSGGSAFGDVGPSSGGGSTKGDAGRAAPSADAEVDAGMTPAIVLEPAFAARCADDAGGAGQRAAEEQHIAAGGGGGGRWESGSMAELAQPTSLLDVYRERDSWAMENDWGELDDVRCLPGLGSEIPGIASGPDSKLQVGAVCPG